MADAVGFTLRARIEEAPGVTARRAALLRRLGVETVGDLVRHLPTRHEFEGAESSVAALVGGAIGTARGEVTATRVVLRGRRRFEAVLTDDTERLDLVWFNQAYLRDRIKPGMRLLVKGKAQRRGPLIQMVNPSWESLRAEQEPATGAERLRPVYPSTEELSSREIERIIARALPAALAQIEDHLPERLRAARLMPSLAEAYRMMHAPADEAEARAGRRRLAYDELLLLQTGLALRRAQREATLKAPVLRWSPEIDRRVRRRLAFTLTPGQDDAVREIVRDLTRETPANRLIQGDVGSGKTAVALYAMLLAAASKRQAALLAPTALLAEQHHATFTELLRGARVRIALLTGASRTAERAQTLAGLASGEIALVIGTHAALGERVRFRSLAVAVIDEQHRFGVHQRAALRAKADDAGTAPHTLVMTATPIPRTLALTVFGDLDVSTVRGLPPGRRAPATRVVGPEKRAEVYEFVRTRIARGERAFIVAPTIEGDDRESGAEGVAALQRALESGPLEGLRLAAMHGRLGAEERAAVMDRFRRGEIDTLVATTIVEVGVDVPEATVMVIEGAERFGLAQLHQLRGRVGRGATRGACVAIGAPTTPDAAERLEAFAKISDGFRLAERDLEIRGPGETIGARQSGVAPFRVATLPGDTDLLRMARRDAREWVRASPRLDRQVDRLLHARTLRAHGEALQLAGVA